MQVARIGIPTAAKGTLTPPVGSGTAQTAATPEPPTLRPTYTATYNYLENLRQVVITLHDPDNGQVIAQLPPSGVIAMAEAAMSDARQRMDLRV